MKHPPLMEIDSADRLSSAEDNDLSASGIRHCFSAVWHQFDWLQIVPMLLLLVIGELFIYGTGQQAGDFAAVTFWRRHLLAGGIGLAVWLFFSIFDYRWCGAFAACLYPVSILLLCLVLIPSIGKKYFGARSWLEFGPINFQPSELAKFAVLVLVAWILSWKHADINKFLWFLFSLMILAVPVILVRLQPDLGSALAMLPPVAAIIFIAKLKWRYILILVVACAILVPLGYYTLKPYQRERVLVFLNPGRDPRNSGWSQLQAEMAVGSGRFTGKGYMNGTHNLLGYLPQKVANSDFIFPVIAEETGFVGAVGLIILFMLLILSILRTAMLTSDVFGRYLCVGIGMLLFFHVYVNIAMNLRLCPVTGLPLPLVSYGGTFLVTTLAYLGIVHSVYRHREKKGIFDV